MYYYEEEPEPIYFPSGLQEEKIYLPGIGYVIIWYV